MRIYRSSLQPYYTLVPKYCRNVDEGCRLLLVGEVLTFFIPRENRSLSLRIIESTMKFACVLSLTLFVASALFLASAVRQLDGRQQEIAPCVGRARGIGLSRTIWKT